MGAAGAAVGIVFVLIYLMIVIGLLGIWIYGFILFVKVAKRGIKALDIYISEKEQKKFNDPNINGNNPNNLQ